MSSAIGRLRHSLREIKRKILYGHGDCKVTPLQQDLLEAFLPTLEPELRALVGRQLDQAYRIAFYNEGRISPFYFKGPNLTPELLIPDPAFTDCLYKIEMFVDGRKQLAHVTFYRGHIFSIELKKPLKFYEGKEVRFGAVTLGTPKQSLAAAIDRAEHGKGSKYATGEE